jgi:hypothetical protein
MPTNCPISAVNRPCPSPTVPRSRHREPSTSTRVAGRINIRENSRPGQPGQRRHSRDLPESRQLIHDQERGIYPCRGPRQCRGGACGGRARVKQAGAEHIQEPEAPPGHLCAPRFGVNVRVPCPCPRLPLNTTPNGLTRHPLSHALLACLPAFSLLKSSSRGSVHALHALQHPSPLNTIFNVIL